MKRRDFLRVAAGTAAASFSFTTIHGAESSSGARKARLLEWIEGFGEEVGWVVANVDASSQLIVEVHLDQGDPDAAFSIWVVVNEDFYSDVGWLTTNAKGVGNEHMTLPVSTYAGQGDSVLYVEIGLIALTP